MSELSVGTLSGLAANSYVVDIASGSSLDLSNATDLPASALPAGSILQVVSTTKTDTFVASVAGGAISGDVTGLTASITPTSASNKVLVTFSVSVALSVANNDVHSILYRDASALTGATGDADGNKFRATASYPGGTLDNSGTMSSIFLDSPATTSSVTYSLRLHHLDSSTRSIYVNRSSSDPDNNRWARFISTITVMEVAG